MNPKHFRNLMESARNIINPIAENGEHKCKGDDCPEHDHGHQEIKHKGKSCKEAHPGMEHEEWEMSQNEEVELDEASQRFGGDTNIPADKKTKGYIESGRAKILLNVQSSLHPSARFVVAKNPNAGSNQDKVMMFTISDPDRSSRIKMFSYHGTHVSHQKAMDFAKKHKLVATKDAKGNPLYAKESVELDESVDLADEVADGVIQTGGLKRNAKEKDIIRAIDGELKNLKFKPTAIAYYMRDKDFMMDAVSEIKSKLKESVELDEDRWKTIPGKEVAKRMRSIKSMKPYASQVAKLKKVNAIDLERLLPHDKVSVKDIDRVMFWKESVELGEGKTEFAVAGTESGMFIKAFPTEKIARQYIKNTYSQKKKLRGKLGVIEVPLGADVVSNQMKRFGKIKVVKESVEEATGTQHGIKNDPAYKKARTDKQLKQAIKQWNLKNPKDLWVGESVEEARTVKQGKPITIGLKLPGVPAIVPAIAPRLDKLKRKQTFMKNKNK